MDIPGVPMRFGRSLFVEESLEVVMGILLLLLLLESWKEVLEPLLDNLPGVSLVVVLLLLLLLLLVLLLLLLLFISRLDKDNFSLIDRLDLAEFEVSVRCKGGCVLLFIGLEDDEPIPNADDW